MWSSFYLLPFLSSYLTVRQRNLALRIQDNWRNFRSRSLSLAECGYCWRCSEEQSGLSLTCHVLSESLGYCGACMKCAKPQWQIKPLHIEGEQMFMPKVTCIYSTARPMYTTTKPKKNGLELATARSIIDCEVASNSVWATRPLLRGIISWSAWLDRLRVAAKMVATSVRGC